MRRLRKIDSGLYEIERESELLGYVAKASSTLWIAVGEHTEVMAETKRDAVSKLMRALRANGQAQEA